MSPKYKTILTTVLFSAILAGCGGSSGDTPPVVREISEDEGDIGELTDTMGGGGEQVDEGDDEEEVEVVDLSADNFSFQITPEFSAGVNEGFVTFLQSEVGGSVAPLNRIDNVFQNVTIPVTYGLCGEPNAFYSPTTREIILCDELTAFSFRTFLGEDTSDEDIDNALLAAVGAVNFVMYHEMGHALDDIRDLGVGGNFESVADAIGVVLSVQTDQPFSALFGAVILSGSGESSFADEHGSGVDRAGDIICWTLGSSSRITAAFPEFAAAYNEAGRDCVAEYANQFDFVERLIPNLSDVPPKASLRSRQSQIDVEAFTGLFDDLAGKIDYSL